jgi:hypothetical protein
MARMRTTELHWRPQAGPQEALLECPIEDIGFGGARGGGKTAGMLGDFGSHEDRYGRYARGLFLRRTYGELEEVIRQADLRFLPMGWTKKGCPATSRIPMTSIPPLKITMRTKRDTGCWRKSLASQRCRSPGFSST